MAHKFDVKNRTNLESEERKRLLSPYKTLKKLGFKKGDTLADIGCGTGLFTIPAAEICGDESKIYAIDVSEEMLADVKKRAEAAGFNNITTVKSDEYDFKINNESVNFVLICAALHEIDDKNRFLKEAARICMQGGTIAIIEFNENSTGIGPPLIHRLSRSLVQELLADAGFTNDSDMDIGEAFYAVTSKKNCK